METLKLDIAKAGVAITADIEAKAQAANALLHSGKGAGNDFLGWVKLPSSISDADIAAIEKEAAKLRAKADVVICIGIGGSYLGAKAVLEAMSDPFKLLHKEQKHPTVLFAGQNISEDYTAELLDAVKEHSIAAIVISKSGTTTEPAIAFRIFKELCEKKYGREGAKERIFATTDKERGALKQNQEIMVCNYHNPDAAPKKAKAVSLYEFDGLGKKPVTESTAGNIICLSGIGDITIGDTICAPECVEALPFVKISAPTMEMTFSINDSPFAGRDGKFVTSRQLRERLFRETLKDVSLRVTEIEGAMDAFNVAGRGEMSLSILIETMRREGYEFQVSPPRVLYQTIDGKKCEPIERLVVDVPAESVGAVIEKIGSRKGDMVEMTPVGTRMKVEFLVPARGLFGYRNEFLTDTKGEGIMASVFDSYAPYKGDLARRNTGSLVAFETGESITYGLFNAQERGQLFIGAGVPVYEGMVVGVSPKQEDITVNVCKKKQLTNMRASGSDDALRLVPPKQMSLEQCLEFLADDELLEVTPHALRIRKTILNHEKRMKATHGGKK